MEDKDDKRREVQKRIIELRTDASPGTPYNSTEDFADIAKEVKQNLGGDLGNQLSDKLAKLQQNNVETNNQNQHTN